MDIKRNFITQNLKTIAILITVVAILALLAFKGNSYYKSNKTLLNRLIQQKDSISEASRIRVDSLMNDLWDSDLRIDELQTELFNKQRQNNYLYSKLKQREKDLYIRDTVFISNANRSAEYINRYNKKNDSIR